MSWHPQARRLDAGSPPGTPVMMHPCRAGTVPGCAVRPAHPARRPALSWSSRSAPGAAAARCGLCTTRPPRTESAICLCSRCSGGPGPCWSLPDASGRALGAAWSLSAPGPPPAVSSAGRAGLSGSAWSRCPSAPPPWPPGLPGPRRTWPRCRKCSGALAPAEPGPGQHGPGWNAAQPRRPAACPAPGGARPAGRAQQEGPDAGIVRAGRDPPVAGPPRRRRSGRSAPPGGSGQ